MNYKLVTKHWKTSIPTISAIILNTLLAILYDPRINIITLSILFVLLSYATTLKYLNEFEFPLFFVRNYVNYWGGLFGGFSGAIGYFFIYEIITKYNITITEIIPVIILFCCIFYLLILLLTATIIEDIKNTNYIETN